MTEPLLLLTSLLALLVIPTICFYKSVAPSDGHDHGMLFIFFGFILFFPAIVVTVPVFNELYALGVVGAPATEAGCDAVAKGDECVVSGYGLLYWIGFGIFIYILDYNFGVAMHRLISEE